MVSWREVENLPSGDEALRRKRAELETLAGAIADDPIAARG